jgi:hypothetical protein
LLAIDSAIEVANVRGYGFALQKESGAA